MKNVTLLNDILKLTAENHFITPPIETLVIHTVDNDGEVAGTLVLNRDWDGGGEVITTGPFFEGQSAEATVDTFNLNLSAVEQLTFTLDFPEGLRHSCQLSLWVNTASTNSAAEAVAT